jgi:hypothetical protein
MLAKLLPQPSDIRRSLYTLLMVLICALVIYPLVAKLPMVGWDWYYVFYHAPERLSAYPPFAKYFLGLLTWMEWRKSLALLSAISLVSIGVGTWQHGGRTGSVLLALLSAPTWYLLWIGHPDGLVLLGMITGIFPLALIKPQISIWYYLKDRTSIIWVAFFILITLIIWPFWFLNFGTATFYYPAAFGWKAIGWPVALVGGVLLLGAGSDPDRLMAAGTLISPYLMPYHLVLLVPIIGRVRTLPKIVLFFSTWLVVLGVGLSGWGKLVCFVFPVLCYFYNHTPSAFAHNVKKTLEIPEMMVKTWIGNN